MNPKWNILWIILIFIPYSFIYVNAEEINLDSIKQIESSGNPNAISFRGAKYGRGAYQISEICLKEFNQFNNTNYKPTDLFDYDLNKTIANWYINKRIPQMLKHFELEDTVKNRLWAYNAGVGRVRQNVMPEETKNYIKKYNRLTGGNK